MDFWKPFNSVLDTMAPDGSESLPVFVLKISALPALVVTVVAGVVLAPVYYAIDKHEQKYKNLISEIDQNRPVAFTSVYVCTTKEFSNTRCEASQTSAMDWVHSAGTSLSYQSSAQCERLHDKHCTAVITPSSGAIWVNGAMMGYSGTSTKFVPDTVGWQAASNDLTKAVPLYATRVPNVGYRFDGQLVALNQ